MTRTTSGNACIGLVDKLYWRKPAGDKKAHCFTKVIVEWQGRIVGYESLCGSFWRRYSGGQSCQRPVLKKRCTECNRLEMERRKWSEPGPANG